MVTGVFWLVDGGRCGYENGYTVLWLVRRYGELCFCSLKSEI